MPKLTVFKKSKMKSSCGDLFADAGLKINFDDDNVKPHFDSDNCVTDDHSFDDSTNSVRHNFCKNENPSRRMGGGEHKRSQSFKEKSNLSSQGIENSGNTIDEEPSGHSINEKCYEERRFSRKRKGTGNSEKECEVSRESIVESERNNRCIDERNLKTSRTVKNKRRKNESTSGEAHIEGEGKIKLTDYPIGEFLEADRILSPRNIEFEKVIADDEFSAWIVLDGKRYKVSKWSVVEGIYHQGLDSLFLVKHYKPCKSNK